MEALNILVYNVDIIQYLHLIYEQSNFIVM